MSAKDGITGGPHGSLVQFEKKDSTSTAAGDTERLQRGAQTLAEPSKELSNGSKDSRKEDLEGIDPAIADALKVLKNRQTVVQFEEDILAFLRSDDEALFFPLSHTGYQRLLAHRTAQYHGLHTATVDDGGEDHGKIRATKPQPTLEPKPLLADIEILAPPEEPKEQHKGGRKKGSDKQQRREREREKESHRGAFFKSDPYRMPHNHAGFQRPRQQMSEPGLGLYGNPYAGVLPGNYPVMHPGFAVPGVSRPSGLRGPEIQGVEPWREDSRARSVSGSSEGEEHRRSPFFPGQPGEEAARLQAGGASSPSSPEAGVQAAHMMAGLSLQQQQQAEGVPGGMVRPGLGMPGYLPMQMPFSFVPGAGGVPQAVPNVQGMGMYGSPPPPFNGYSVPYGYGPGQPGQQLMPQMMTQPVGPGGMMHFYPGFLPQGYPMSGLPMQTPPGAFPGPMVVQQSSGVGSPLGSLGQLMVSAPTLAQHSRVSSGLSFTDQRQSGLSATSSESVSGEASASSPPCRH